MPKKRLLDEILAHKRAETAARKRKISEQDFREMAADAPAAGGFSAALRARLADGRPAVIAELKKASPSRGALRADFDPAGLAAGFRRGGAAALSVLTDAKYFQGSGAVLELARRGGGLPILRKDFILEPYQIHESRAMGAAAVLLIAAALPGGELAALHRLARDCGLDALVEVHDEDELARAAAAGAELIGVNNRDLQTFAVDLAVTERLAPLAPPGALLVAESGVRGAGDLARLRRCGVGAFLIGEALMRAADPGARLAELLAAA